MNYPHVFSDWLEETTTQALFYGQVIIEKKFDYICHKIREQRGDKPLIVTQDLYPSPYR